MSKETLQLDDAHDYLKRVIAALRAMERHEKGMLVAVLEHLSAYIHGTRNEIAALRPGDTDDDMLSSASDHLEEIVTETANATNTIMSAAETIEKLCENADPETAAAVLEATTRIYEACAFQDITGQRITRIVRALQSIETKLAALTAVCGMDIGAAKRASASPAEKSADEGLLNGPQLAGDANSQDDIDKLLASLG